MERRKIVVTGERIHMVDACNTSIQLRTTNGFDATTQPVPITYRSVGRVAGMFAGGSTGPVFDSRPRLTKDVKISIRFFP